jgi:CRISPR system Cascade subunit CasA
MVTGYNLVDEPWIPCVLSDGRTEELSLAGVFENAVRVKELAGATPLEPAALLRFLLAVLYRASGNITKEKWRRLWEAKTLDTKALSRYLKQWHTHFDLFDREAPFYQNPRIVSGKPWELSRLTFADSASCNSALFSHESYFANPPRYTPAQAARILITFQAFAPNMGNSVTGYTSNAPDADVYTVLAKGDYLFETMLLNLCPYDNNRVAQTKDDAPAWERPKWRPGGKPRTPDGLTDLYTWQTRAINLIPEIEGEAVYCRYCHHGHGKRLKAGFGFDPMVGYDRTKKNSDDETVVAPWKLNPKRAVWRDCEVLFASFHDPDTYMEPACTEWVARLVNAGLLSTSFHAGIELLAYRKRKASEPTVMIWRQGRFPLPLAYLGADSGKSLVDTLRKSLKLAEDVAGKLSFAALVFARGLIDGDAENLRAPLKPKQAEEDARKLRGSFGVETQYWAVLEEPFYRLLSNIPEDRDAAEGAWAEVVEKTVWAAFDDITGEIGNNARSLKSATYARDELARGLCSTKEGKEGVLTPYKERR